MSGHKHATNSSTAVAQPAQPVSRLRFTAEIPTVSGEGELRESLARAGFTWVITCVDSAAAAGGVLRGVALR